MKKTFAIFALSIAAVGSVAQADITLASFGTGQFTVNSGWNTFTTGLQTATTYEVTGVDGGSYLYGTLPSTVNITGNDIILKLTATFSGAANSDFQIDLLDSAGNDRTYLGSFAAFTPNVEMTITLSLGVTTGDFDASKIKGLQLLTNGPGKTMDLTLKTLTASAEAIPEPSSYALLATGLAATFVFVRGRQRKSLGVSA